MSAPTIVLFDDSSCCETPEQILIRFGKYAHDDYDRVSLDCMRPREYEDYNSFMDLDVLLAGNDHAIVEDSLPSGSRESNCV